MRLLKNLGMIITDSDISLASVITGTGLVVWALIAMSIQGDAIEIFARELQMGNKFTLINHYIWLANYILVGAGFILIAGYDFPPTPTLLFGSYVVLIWTWIASAKSYASITSGVTLNVVVILMGALLIQRSGSR